MSNTTEKKEKQSFGQFIKFALFSASAGIIQVLTFTLLSEVVIKLPAIQSAMESNATFARIMQNEYGPMYLTALILSVVWNFTFNRKFTFKSAANVPVAMLKVFAFYLVFTPISTLLGNYFTAKFADVSAINYIVLGLTMATNMITEFLYDKFVVFRGQDANGQAVFVGDGKTLVRVIGKGDVVNTDQGPGQIGQHIDHGAHRIRDGVVGVVDQGDGAATVAQQRGARTALHRAEIGQATRHGVDRRAGRHAAGQGRQRVAQVVPASHVQRKRHVADGCTRLCLPMVAAPFTDLQGDVA